MDFQMIGMLCAATGAVVVVPEYSLAPEAPFPVALNQMELMYRCVAGGGLGYLPSQIILVGESAGANLLASLTSRVVQDDRLLQPSGLVMGYPALNLALSPSPSRALHFCDPLLSYGITRCCVDAYTPQGLSVAMLPEVSPAFTPEHILACFPPTYLQTGGMDPLLDDSVDFYTRLQRVLPLEQHARMTKLEIYRHLPHGIWGVGHWLPEARVAMEQVCEWCVDLLKQGQE
eukprot:TRINITY_DN7888_c0_g2_i16.p1 TRINITY_DN7888_c0_g2~~TRINITY_DN7888_c0_g2_i16.p1  ORF type:complete len:231 (-),score=41.74 TRINITY_DN7888_c0_g2_i16:176-868(-)